MRRPLQAKPKKNEDIFFLSTLSWNLRGGDDWNWWQEPKKCRFSFVFLQFSPNEEDEESRTAHIQSGRVNRCPNPLALVELISIEIIQTEGFFYGQPDFGFLIPRISQFETGPLPCVGFIGVFIYFHLKKKAKVKKKLRNPPCWWLFSKRGDNGRITLCVCLQRGRLSRKYCFAVLLFHLRSGRFFSFLLFYYFVFFCFEGREKLQRLYRSIAQLFVFCFNRPL